MVNLATYLVAFGEVAASTRVVMTRAAQGFVSPEAIGAVTGNPVFTDDSRGDLLVPHINLPAWADLFLVLPATANVLAKAATGIADDLLSTTVLAAEPPVFFVPSMNPGMWSRPSVQRNVRTLEADGHHVIVSPVRQRSLEVATREWVESDLMPTPVEVLEAIAEHLPSR